MSKLRFVIASRALEVLCLFGLIAQMAHGQSVPLVRLDSPQPSLSTGNAFGRSVDVSDRYVLIGEPLTDMMSPLQGAVHVFDARSGRHLRRINPPEPSAEGFGTSVALYGHLAVVGMPGGNGLKGAAHLFDLRTGKHLRTFSTSDPDAYQIGWRVAVANNRVAVSSRAQEDERGAVYVFDLNAGGEPLLKLQASDRDIEDQLGHSLAFSGDLLAAGALLKNNARGAVYLFDVRQPGSVILEALKILPGDLNIGDLFGSAVDLLGTTLIAGARGQNSSRGAVYHYDLGTSLPTLVRKLTLPGAEAESEFGESVVMEDNLIAVGAPGDDDVEGKVALFNARDGALLTTALPIGQNKDARHGWALALSGGSLVIGAPQAREGQSYTVGAAWHLRDLARPLALHAVARSGGPAAGVTGGLHGAFREAFITPDGRICFTGAISGSGAAGGKNFGAWVSGGQGSLRSLAQIRAPLPDSVTVPTPGAVVKSLGSPLTGWSSTILLPGRLSGPGVGKSNEQVLLSHDTLSVGALFRCGRSYSPFATDQRLETFTEVTQNQLMLILRHRLARGQGGVDNTNDSGILMWADGFGVFDAPVREGMDLGVGRSLGEVSGPVAGGAAMFPWSGFCAPFIDSDGKVRRAVFTHYAVGMNPIPSILAQEDNPAYPLNGGERFSSFPGLAVAANTVRLFRATLQSGGTVNSSNNEGLWLENLGVIARKGQAPDPQRSLEVFKRFLGFWPVGEYKAIFHAQLAGPGINSANDGGLWLWEYDITSPVLRRLMREGEGLALPDGPRVGVIQRVDVASYGWIAVLTSLTGSAPGANQMLWTGLAAAGNNTILQALRHPAPRLRKGTRGQIPLAEPVVINGLSLTPTTDRFGAGGRGAGHVINGQGVVALQVRYTNRISEILIGRP